MAVTKPVCFTEVPDAEVSLNRPTSEELMRKLFQNMNMMNELAVIGSIDAYAVNIPGVPVLEATIHQLCDGTEITEPHSPLRTINPTTRNAPDIRNRFIRGANASTNSGNELGGSDTVNLAHDHGGVTGEFNGPINGEQGGDHNIADGHHHSIASALNATEPLDPAHMQIAYYLKIN